MNGEAIFFICPIVLYINCWNWYGVEVAWFIGLFWGFTNPTSVFKECWPVIGLFKVLTCLLSRGKAGDMLTLRVLTFSYRNRSALRPPAKMNMVKRIMGRPRQEECSPQDNALGLMHLRRLFTELCHPPRHMTQKEQEEKLYMMLPVFNRVSPACQNPPSRTAVAAETLLWLAGQRWMAAGVLFCLVCCQPDVEHTSLSSHRTPNPGD